MKHFECECMKCGAKSQIGFLNEDFPNYGQVFLHTCKKCNQITEHRRVLTKKTNAELKKTEAENQLRKSIINKCKELNLGCEFWYRAVIITTPISKWNFDYHRMKITLYHESTVKVNFKTGNPAALHIQFKDKKIKPIQVIDYIAQHDEAKMRGRMV